MLWVLQLILMGFLSRFSRLFRIMGPVFPPGKTVVKKMQPLIIIYGSTGTGKSDVSAAPLVSATSFAWRWAY